MSGGPAAPVPRVCPPCLGADPRPPLPAASRTPKQQLPLGTGDSGGCWQRGAGGSPLFRRQPAPSPLFFGKFKVLFGLTIVKHLVVVG